MTADILSKYSSQVRALIQTVTSADVQRALDELVENECWELLSHLLPTASELAARRATDRLLEEGQYEILACTACLRRQPRRPGLEAAPGGATRPILRDFEAEEATEGVPEHIMAEAKEISAAAAQRREVSRRGAAQIDRDPIRDLIVHQLAQRLPDPGAGEALLVIAQACPFEHTQRDAALKLANHDKWVKQLADGGRSEDLISVSNSAGLETVAQNIAQVLGELLSEFQEHCDEPAISFVAEHHPDAQIRRAAYDALS